MFIHIGNNNTVLTKDIIAILDKKTVEKSEATREFIKDSIERNVLKLEKENIKTYIIAESANSQDKYRIYTSNISSQALQQRMNK